MWISKGIFQEWIICQNVYQRMINKGTEIWKSDLARDADLITFRFEPFESQIKIFGTGAGRDRWGSGFGGPVW